MRGWPDTCHGAEKKNVVRCGTYGTYVNMVRIAFSFHYFLQRPFRFASLRDIGRFVSLSFRTFVSFRFVRTVLSFLFFSFHVFRCRFFVSFLSSSLHCFDLFRFRFFSFHSFCTIQYSTYGRVRYYEAGVAPVCVGHTAASLLVTINFSIHQIPP